MSLALVITLASSAVTLPTCSWDNPGHTPFMGDVVAAVDRYVDIPSNVRAALKRRMAARDYDDMATIERDAVKGKYRYASDLRDMHFGQGQVCASVSRASWAPGAVERGLVYCEGRHCVIVPTVCRNVSRITRLPDRQRAELLPASPKSTAQDGAGHATVSLAQAADAGTAPSAPMAHSLAIAPSAASGAAPGAEPDAASGAATRAAPSSFEALAADPSTAAGANLPAPGPLPTLVAQAAPQGPASAAADPPNGGVNAGETSTLAAPSILPFVPGAAPGLNSSVALAVPEPHPWMLWVAGLVTIGWVAGRRSSPPPR